MNFQAIRTMENLRGQQEEALRAAYDYTKRLQNGIETIIPELRGEKQEDTKEFLDQILKGINWIIQVTNGTMSLINEKEQRINKEDINYQIISLNAALTENDDQEIVRIFEEGILPFLNELKVISKEIAGCEEN